MAPIHETVLLMASNLFYLLPGGFAFKRGFPFEGTAYIMTFIVSTLYHYVDTGHYLPFMKYSTGQALDFWGAFLLISTTGTMIIYFTGYEEEPDVVRRNVSIKSITNLTLTYLVLWLVLEDADSKYLIVLLASVLVLLLVVAVVWYRENLAHIDLYDLVTGAVVLFGASMCYFYGSADYWIIHSMWHILSALAILLMIEALNRRWSLVKCLLACCSRRIEVYGPTAAV